jgi:hypothetical protein
MLPAPTVWELLLEWCAEIFGVTVRSKLGQLAVFAVALFGLGLFLSMRWGVAGWLLPAVLVGLSVAAARQVSAARNEVWRAACESIEAEHPPPPELRGVLSPTATALMRLAAGVDAVRRGRYVTANDLVPQIDRDLLRSEELQLLDAVRAMVSMGIGSTQRAAQQAVVALPTGSDELDTCLGRTVVSDAWHDAPRLAAIQRAWDRAGVKDGPLSKLRGLVRIRLDDRRLDRVPAPEARELADEARAIGDDDLASELDARARPTAYR